jgi:DNA-binding CsgD family transcriptional regulator
LRAIARPSPNVPECPGAAFSNVEVRAVTDSETASERARLVGRDEEQAAIAQLLTSARNGISGVLLMRGDIGIGKTALLEAATASREDLAVVHVVGIESEMELGFAGLHQLLHRFIDEIDTLPEPQARALRAAFGLGEDSAPDRFLVGLAALTLLSRAAARSGLLMTIDDAQWLDSESATALGFVARRLYADGIAMLVAVREPPPLRFAFDGLPTVTLSVLRDDTALELLAASVTPAIAPQVRTRILAEAGGNPLALIELGRGLSPEAAAGTEILLQPLAVGERLEAQFVDQVRALPTETQRLLLVAAADPTGDPALVWHVAHRLDLDESAMGHAEAQNLVRLGAQIRFRHSLIRSAIYQSASDTDRRQAHAALASAAEARADPDLQAWHRAAAAHAPDEDVAREVEEAANRVLGRGSCSAAAALFARAAQLTADSTRQAIRFLRAAATDLTAGRPARAHAHLMLAMPALDDAALVAQARRLDAAALFMSAVFDYGDESPASDHTAETTAIMLDAAAALHAFDARAARDALFDALMMAVYFGRSATTGTRDVSRAVRSLPLAADSPPTSIDQVLDALAELYLHGYDSAAPLLRQALSAIRADPGVRDLQREMASGCHVAFALSDDDSVETLAGEWVALLRDRGALGLLPEGLYYLGLRELRVGSLAGADVYFSEDAETEALVSRKGTGRFGRLIVAAWRGDEAEVRAAAASMAQEAEAFGRGWNLTQIEYAMGVLELGLGNYQAACELTVDDAFEEFALGAFRAADVVEAHSRGGDRALAQGPLESLAQRAPATGSAIDRGLLARSRALLAVDDEAESHFHEAIAHFESSGGPLHLARTQLLYGEWLRRQKRRRDARDQLAVALAIFESMGAGGFAQRARVELLATGANARRRVDETRDDLTPQELQIARLAAGGATNPEIATQLFISASTVDYHLRKVYRKLDIRSRRELFGAIFATT